MREDSPFLKCDITMEVINLAFEMFKAEFPKLKRAKKTKHEAWDCFCGAPFEDVLRWVADNEKPEDLKRARQIASQAQDRMNEIQKSEDECRRAERRDTIKEREHQRVIEKMKARPESKRKWYENVRAAYNRQSNEQTEQAKWFAVAKIVVASALHGQLDYLSPTKMKHLLNKLHAPGARSAKIEAEYADTLRREVEREEKKTHRT